MYQIPRKIVIKICHNIVLTLFLLHLAPLHRVRLRSRYTRTQFMSQSLLTFSTCVIAFMNFHALILFQQC